MLFVYMLDKDHSFVFETTYEGLKGDTVAEGGNFEDDTTPSAGYKKGKPLISNETLANVSSVLETSMTAIKTFCENEPGADHQSPTDEARSIQLQEARRGLLDNIRNVRSDASYSVQLDA